ncbi:DUF1156 domain-containing protein [Candidatus Thorarchaeota archaeon]|nr:MAG: DUF1156 domain-containing protein [Candidatus Thorarchaeota archaeon]
MHKWWARRLGSVFRTILLYSLADSSLEGWDGDPETLWQFYARDVNMKSKTVLDPMMGGGTTIVESLRFGCRVIGGDLNPVAWFVVKKQVEDLNPELLEQSLKELDEDLGDDLRRYYVTRCPVCGRDAEGLYYFYTKMISCPDCGEEVPLVRDFFLARAREGEGDVVVCPSCWSVFEAPDARKSVLCPQCSNEFIPKNSGHVKGRSFSCSNEECRSYSIVDHIRKNGRPSERLYAVEFYCPYCDNEKEEHLKNGRGYKTRDDQDVQLLEAAREEFRRVGRGLPIPDTEIPDGVETRRALNHQYERFRDMFNERQLLNLGKIYRWILQEKDANLREFLILAFSNCLKYNNMFCKYNGTRGFITDIFRTHSFSPSMAPVECNCYDTAKGRGSFSAFVNLVIEGKEYCMNPFERHFQNGQMRKTRMETRIQGDIVGSYDALEKPGNALLICGSSSNLEIPDHSVDVVVTDPPYADNVMYSELSNFFYVWLKIGLDDDYEEFKGALVPWEKEVIANRVQGKSSDDFLGGLRSVFQETNRVLKEGGTLVFTFHHRSLNAWSSVLQAVLDAGFFVRTIYPVRSEMKASTHFLGKDNIKYDMIIVCKKRKGQREVISWHRLASKIRSSATRLMKRMGAYGENLGHLDRYVIAVGKCLELYSKHYPQIMDGVMTVDVATAVERIESWIFDIGFQTDQV